MAERSHDPWAISEADFPIEGSTDDQLRYLCRWGLLAPSSHNTQPWKLKLGDGAVEVRADRSRQLKVADPRGRELTISCGAAVYHIQLAVRRFGHEAETELLPDAADPDLFARIRLGSPREANHEDLLLFGAIKRRRTNRLDAAERPLNDELVGALEDAARREGAWLYEVDSTGERQALAALVSEADRSQWQDAAFRAELAAWLRPNFTRHRDGVPGWSLGLSNVASALGAPAVRWAASAEAQARRDAQMAMQAPSLMVLGTLDDGQQSWLRAGMALGHVLLRAAAEGAHAAYLSAPIETEALRAKVSAAIGRQDFAQMLMRVAYADDDGHTPRRGLDEVT